METEEVVTLRRVTCRITFRALVLFSELIVLFALIVCVVSSLVFQFYEVIDHDCGDATPNFLATISSVTGVSPQRYLWRFCIALHSTPRIVMALAYYQLYMSSASRLFALRSRPAVCSDRERAADSDGESRSRGNSASASHTDGCKSVLQWIGNTLWRFTRTRRFLEAVVFVNCSLNLVEVFCLMGISFISNRESYAVHEKLFEVFGLSHLLYAFGTLWVTKRLHEPPSPSVCLCPSPCNHCIAPCVAPNGVTRVYARRHGLRWTPDQQSSYKRKWQCTITVLLLTIVMLFLFDAHTDYCVPYAFTLFSLAEYVATLGNMAFHYTAVQDLPGTALILGVRAEARPNGYHHVAESSGCRTSLDNSLDAYADSEMRPQESLRRRSAGAGESDKL